MAKDKEIKLRSYLNKDSVMLLKSAIATEQEEFSPFDIHRRRIAFDRAIVNTFSDNPIIEMSEEYGKEYMRNWSANVGRLLCRDFRKCKFDLYFEMTTADLRAILRMLSHDEVSSKEFDQFDLIEYGDKVYVIMKIVGIDQNYLGSNINEILTEPEEPDEEIATEDDYVNGNEDVAYISIDEL